MTETDPHLAELQPVKDEFVPSPDAVRTQMERILAAPMLEASQRRRTLFRYLVEETLAGRGDRLKGFNIALAVFNRDATFDSQTDPIVRIEARRLRSDLDGYYAGPGQTDALRISIPKGGYAPHFSWRNGPEAPSLPDEGHKTPLRAVGVETETGRDATATAPTHATFRRAMGLTATAVVLLVAVVAGALWLLLNRTDPAQVASATDVPVIVLPFAVAGTAPEDRYVAEGLTQELISDLTRFSGLRLYARNASFGQAPDADPQKLGADLGAAYVVRGNVRTEREVLHVGADLVDAASGRIVWSGTFDSTMSPGAVLAIQKEVAGRIATELGQTYGAVKSDLVAQTAAEDAPVMDSFLCVLRGFGYRRSFDPAEHVQVMDCLQKAVAQDPNYAEAWAMLGWLRLDAARYNLVPPVERPRVMVEAVEAATRAVRIDPDSVNGLQALAAIDYYLGRFDVSESLMRRALALNPNDPDTLVQLGWRLAARGKWDEGIPYVEAAIARTVRPPGWYYHSLAIRCFLDGDYSMAIEHAERSAMNGSAVGWSVVAASQAALGNTAEAREAVARMAEADPDMGADPEAVFRTHQIVEPTVEALVAGLKKAGWTAP